MTKRCASTTKSGTRCKKNAADGSDCCTTHNAQKKRKIEEIDDQSSTIPQPKRLKLSELSYFTSNKEAKQPLFMEHNRDILSCILDFVPCRRLFSLRTVHPTWTKFIDGSNELWSQLGMCEPLHFKHYSTFFEQETPNFCDEMRKVYLKLSYAKLAQSHKLFKFEVKKVSNHFQMSKIQMNQLLTANKQLKLATSFQKNFYGIIGMTDDGCIFKIKVQNLLNKMNFIIFMWSMGDTWIGAIHISEDKDPYAGISDSYPHVVRYEDSEKKVVEDESFLEVLNEAAIEAYNNTTFKGY
ncbi:hypothetical protein AKO1_000273 [Acrasis kona]|uniref:F-box domain-containing protein n=1 Tax=Acrasis kona TaxID=1008807 RepID=A0AAW2YNG7_9EUKA